MIRGSVFQKLFEQAKIANMTKEELAEYEESLKNYRDMYLIENEYKRNLAAKDSTIAAMQRNLIVKDKTIATKDKSLQKALSENAKIKAKLAELERKYRPN